MERYFGRVYRAADRFSPIKNNSVFLDLNESKLDGNIYNKDPNGAVTLLGEGCDGRGLTLTSPDQTSVRSKTASDTTVPGGSDL